MRLLVPFATMYSNLQWTLRPTVVVRSSRTSHQNKSIWSFFSKTLLVLLVISSLYIEKCDSLRFTSKKSNLKSDVIDEIDAKQLEKLIEEQESVALFLYPRSCTDECQTILNVLEKINDDANEIGIFLVRNSERAVAKQYDINKMPSLVYFKQNNDPSVYSGDLKKSDSILEWLNSIKSLDLPDKIEEINASGLSMVIDDYDYVAVLFYEDNCKKCERVLHRLEEIDDDADEQGIGFVKLADSELAFEYGLETLPALVYYRQKIPIVYTGDLEDEQKVLEWLFDFRDTVEDFEAGEDSIIEDVNSKVLEALIKNTDQLAVLFYDQSSKHSTDVLNELEHIDDDCDQAGILLVKIDDRNLVKQYGLRTNQLPTMVFFEQKQANIYDGDLSDEEKVLEWLLERAHSDEIEQLTSELFEQQLQVHDRLAVVLFDRDSPRSKLILDQLENIDDDCDKMKLPLVKLDDSATASRYGLSDRLPALIYFEHQLPSIYQGDLRNEDKVLRWLHTQVNTDEIEEVTHELLDELLEHNDHLLVLFYKPQGVVKPKTRLQKNKKCSSLTNDAVLESLEKIDEKLDDQGIGFVKTDDLRILEQYGLIENSDCDLPKLIYFEDEVPHEFKGDLLNSKEVTEWVIEQHLSEEIEHVNAKILNTLVYEEKEQVAVLFFDPKDSNTDYILKELENIDDECDDHEINFVKVDDLALAKEYGVADELPILMYFEQGLPTIYEGDLSKEEKVLEWLLHQKSEDTIEEVTEEMLEKLIKQQNLILVYFAPNECKECSKILEDLETIDDDTDQHGILFVTTDDLNLARNRFKLKKFPALVLIQNEDEFAVYPGDDLSDEQAVLEWVTSMDLMDDSDEIEPVNERNFEKLLERSDYVVALFTRPNRCKQCDAVKEELEKIDHLVEENDIDFVEVSDPSVAEDYGVGEFPSIVFFAKRFPRFYDGPDMLDEDAVMKWIFDQKESGSSADEIETVEADLLRELLDDLPSIAVFFYDGELGCGPDSPSKSKGGNPALMAASSENCRKTLATLEQIDDEAFQLGIHFVRSGDTKLASELHVHKLPALVYFEHGAASLYTGSTQDSNTVLTWLRRQRLEDTIEEISREMLFQLATQHEYLAVFFYKTADDEIEEILEHLERIDDDCAQFEIQLVKLRDELIAKKYGIRQLPGLALFRRGEALRYDGNLFDEHAVLDWLTRVENMDSKDAIERVNARMFERLLAKMPQLAVLFYSETECKQCEKVLLELERIDDEADEAGIRLVKVDDVTLAKRYGVHALPALLFFKRGEDQPIIFAGDLKRSNKILDWLVSQKDPNLDRIEDVDGDQLRSLIEQEQHLSVYFYSDDCDDCEEILNDLENIDSETDRYGIAMVKVKDARLADSYGCENLPAIVYFEEGMPSVYQDEMNAESVLQWLLQQRTEDTIEEVNREILEGMVDNTHYLVVLFYKPNCRACEIVLEELEHIDDECDIYGIHMVKIQDVQLAKRYAIRTFPALMYFRNGNPLLFDGDLRNEDSVLEWLIDDDNRELQDEIEHVNHRMLEKLVQESPFLVVYFYDETCDSSDDNCDGILSNLEQIDDELDVFGIDFVKVDDPIAIRQWRISNLPSVVYFRKRNIHFYDGDLLDEQRLLNWLTSEDVFELKDEIEEVNRKMLDKFMAENDYIAVYFYDNDCAECEEILKELERIDDEADDLDIMFVKIRDLRYAKKYGIVSMPSLVFFRKKFPSVYRGDLMKEEEVLEWLRKNRYRHPEISIFMYGLILVTGGFICYTLFLIFFMRPKEKKE